MNDVERTHRCGRLDSHEEHGWSVPRWESYGWSLTEAERVAKNYYWCPGHTVIEGGHGVHAN